tara:strand:+ start:12339 stop:12671 length:333 start_codon:yes stop_codon:yes gene_type:complete
MKQFTQTNYKKILKLSKVAMIFFTSSNCHLCVKLKPILEKLQRQHKKIDFYVSDIDKEKKLTKLLVKEDGVPTGFIMKTGLIFKIKDPESPDDDTWYSEKYLQKLIKTLQ